MTPKKKIIVFSPPFSGHLNVLKDLLSDHRDEFDFMLVVTGWKNIPVNLDGLKVPVAVLGSSPLQDTDPALWTLPRVAELLEECLEITKKFQPDLILYDFFSPEGYFAGKLLDIPYWCSIPALMGPFTHQKYLRKKLISPGNQEAIKSLATRFGIRIDSEDIEMISDGLHLPGEVNMVWSYPSVTPPDYQQNRSDVPYIFVGSTKEHKGYIPQEQHHRPRIYVSFGTVIMNNLWDQQDETRIRLIEFITTLAQLWKDRPWDITFVSQGKKILDTFPKNWRVFETVDQVKMLSKSDVFLTHGGGNSFHEAIVKKVPMVVLPFFGDQPLVAKRVEQLGLGINLGKDFDIDTHKSKDFLNKNLAREVDMAVLSVLDDPKYKRSFDNLSLEHADIKNLLGGKIHFNEGVLLFGTNVARKKYVDETDAQDTFKILEFKAFSELVSKENALPRIVDIYHDVVLSDDYFNKDIASNLDPYREILKRYKEHLGGETDFCRMCIKGLDFFSELYKIHFILSDYDPKMNYITAKEIGHVVSNKSRFSKSVIFYKKVSGAWIPVDYSEVESHFL